MLVRLRLTAWREHHPAAPSPERDVIYPLRWSSWGISAGLHMAVLCLISIAPSGASRSPSQVDDRSDEMFRPRKVIYYRFPPKLPDVASETQKNEPPTPRGAELSRSAMIARAEQPQSRQQMIWTPAPQIEIPLDVPAPNVILREGSPVPLPVAPQKALPKPFVAPPRTAREPAPGAPLFVDQVPSVTPSPLMASAPVAPQIPHPVPVPMAEVPRAGNASVDVAVAGLRPAESAAEIPAGERRAQFSKAPSLGAGSGGPGKAGIVVPNLTIRNEDKGGTNAEREPSDARPVLYSDRLRNLSGATFSVPLRPANRTIPAALDARFRGRNVYTMVVPIENFPAYAGDWIMWFAEKDPPQQPSSEAVRAPVPFRKMEPAGEGKQGPFESERARLSAVLGRDGRLQSISVISTTPPAAAQAFLRDLRCWEFKPATRNHTPIEVEVVLEIPLNLPAGLARRQP